MQKTRGQKSHAPVPLRIWRSIAVLGVSNFFFTFVRILYPVKINSIKYRLKKIGELFVIQGGAANLTYLYI